MVGLSHLYDIRAVVFDAVGTLIHPQPAASVVYAEVGRRFGSCQDPARIANCFARAFARQEQSDYDLGLRTNEDREKERWQQIVAEVLDDVADPAACFRELFEHFSRPESWNCDPEASRTIETFSAQGYTLGIASNYDRRLRSVVAGLSALQPVRHLIISSEAGWRKPAREFFTAVCQAVAARPGEVLYVGDDWSNDYEGAVAVGMRAVLFDARRRRVDCVVPRIERLSQLLTAIP